jgi:hypothetical protein
MRRMKPYDRYGLDSMGPTAEETELLSSPLPSERVSFPRPLVSNNTGEGGGPKLPKREDNIPHLGSTLRMLAALSPFPLYFP